jgi:hypothetical protein
MDKLANFVDLGMKSIFLYFFFCLISQSDLLGLSSTLFPNLIPGEEVIVERTIRSFCKRSGRS